MRHISSLVHNSTISPYFTRDISLLFSNTSLSICLYLQLEILRSVANATYYDLLFAAMQGVPVSTLARPDPMKVMYYST